MKQLRDLIERVRRTPVTVGDNAVDAMAYFDSGIEKAGSGRHRRAVELFSKAIELSPAAAAGMSSASMICSQPEAPAPTVVASRRRHHQPASALGSGSTSSGR